jgi:ubiquinone/menaquinone biosynthesis C-methylase UbiE
MALDRVLEPEVMDSEQEAQEYNDMDHSLVNQRFVEEIIAFAKSTIDSDQELELGDVLDLGTGTALIPIELCKQHEHCRVMAIDMAVSMLELAVYNIEAAGMTDRITLAKIDAKELSYEDEMFDSVISNSIIHHIPEPIESLSEMNRVCSEGGLIFVRDLMRPDDEATLEKIVQTYAGEETEYSQKLFRDSLHAALSLDEIRELAASLGFDPETVTATSDRHWTWAARK